MLQIPIEILIPLLELNTWPTQVFIRASLGDENHIFVSDNTTSMVYESCMFNLEANVVYGLSDGWKELLGDFCNKGFVWQTFQERYPHLLEKGRINSSLIKWDASDFEPTKTSKLDKKNKETSNKNDYEDSRNEADEYWENFEGDFI